MRYNKSLRDGVCLWSLPLLLLLCLFACKDDSEEFSLSESRMEIFLNGTFDLSVKGTDTYTITLSDGGIVEYATKGNIITVKGVGKGATTMEVTASNGLKKNCFIIVRENKADINFLEDPLSRVEWNTEIGCSDAQDGFSFAEYKSMDAFGGGNANTMTYDFSTVEDTEVFYRVSAKGDFTVSADVKAQAQADIAEDGYWGVEQTSDRILDFAKALSGDDPDKADAMLEAFKKGFEQATKAWGEKLPDISQRTYDAVVEKFNKWKNGTEDASTEA